MTPKPPTASTPVEHARELLHLLADRYEGPMVFALLAGVAAALGPANDGPRIATRAVELAADHAASTTPEDATPDGGTRGAA